jgi:hypothetical protein
MERTFIPNSIVKVVKSRQQRSISCPMKRASNFTRVSDRTTTRINKVKEKQLRGLQPFPK